MPLLRLALTIDRWLLVRARLAVAHEVDRHARAERELPIPEISLRRHGASHVLLATEDCTQFHFEGIEQALSIPGVDLRIFGKPITRPNRRMGVILAPSVQIATKAANCIRVVSDLSS